MDGANVTCVNVTSINGSISTLCTPFNEADEPLTTFAKARIIIYIITFTLSLMGNGCVVLVTLRKSCSNKAVTAFKLLITHLAIVDFIFSCNIFVLIPNELYNAEADDGLSMCIFKRLLRQVPLEASIGTIAVIAVERYRGIAQEFRARKWTPKRVFISLLIVWIISFAVYIPSMLSIRIKGDFGCQEIMSPSQKKLHAVFLILVEYVVPLSVVAYCHFKIIKVIHNRSSTVTELQPDENANRNEEHRKTARILFAIVIGFAVIALPNQVFFAYLDLGDKHQSFSVTWDVLQLMGILLLVHSVFNPVIYSVIDSQFRQEVKEICCCCCLQIIPKMHSSTSSTPCGKRHAEECVMAESNVN